MNRKQFISMLDSSCIINVFLKLCLKRFKGYFEGMLLDNLYCSLNKVKNFIKRSVCFLTFSPYMKNRKNLYSEVLNRPVSGERRYFSYPWKFCNSVIIFFNYVLNIPFFKPKLVNHEVIINTVSNHEQTLKCK